ncbi:MAG TPA: tol-pal system protein YbgF [Stellaceae bacterium]|nr:tol-pal system protein YbgF [Stellaceae bacterium]
MFPDPSLSHTRFALSVLAALVLLPAGLCYGQSIDDRLDRLERDLNMLQRQVYRGAPTAGAPGPADPANAANLEIRMERLESQMRDLTGRVEQVANGLEQLKQRVEQINSDIDVRLGQMPGTAAAGAPPPPRFPEPPASATATAAPTSLMPSPGTVVPPPGAGPTPIFNTLTPPGAGPPRPPPSPPQSASAEPPPATGSTTQQFNAAIGLVKQADYAAAEAALRSFIAAHPNDPLAANAQYFLGETFYARNKYMDAASAFADGYKRYPKGAKAADDLLMLGMSLARADQKKNACVALAQLDQQFPNTSASIKERAGAERKRLGC